MKKSITSRSMQLLSLAAKVGRKELSQSLKEQFTRGVDEITSGRLKTRIDQAKLIAENLSQLKGAAMKAGQLLSLDASDLFPPEAVEILSKLQGKADPVEWSIVHQVLLEELGEEKFAQFEGFNQRAAASASIGQVHRAKLRGRDVAVKIQYPGVSDSIESDLKILKTIAQSGLALTGRRMDLDEVFLELTTVLQQEANYELELQNMREYRRLLQKESESHLFTIPEPTDSHSTRRVLTMSWQDGMSLSDWLKTSPAHEERSKIGRLLLDLYCKEFFEWGLVQTDPNYGNFLIQDHPTRLVVLDFGATLRYSEEFRHQYIELLKAMSSLDRQKITRSFTDFGLIDERESDESRQLLADMMILSLEPFQPHRQPFRFKDDEYARRTREATQRFTQSLRYSPPPRRLLFLHRKLGGVFAFLKKLDVQIDVTPYWEQMLSIGSDRP